MQSPTRVGKYELEEFLGEGMSQVYYAQDTVPRRNVAERIVDIYDFGEEQARQFSVADVPGKLRIARQVASALEYIHSEEIIHRDIEPDNVHIDVAGHVKPIDFGVAKSQDFSRRRLRLFLESRHAAARA